MSVSHIDTTVQLSQRTLNALFGNESGVELSQATVPLVFDLSAVDLNVETSGLNGEAEPPATASCDGTSPFKCPARVSELKRTSILSLATRFYVTTRKAASERAKEKDRKSVV